MAINLFLLLLVSWISFPTALLAQHLRGPDERIAAIVYSGTFVTIAIVSNVLWRYARRGGHTDEPEHPITGQYKYGPVFYAILLVVGVFKRDRLPGAQHASGDLFRAFAPESHRKEISYNTTPGFSGRMGLKERFHGSQRKTDT